MLIFLPRSLLAARRAGIGRVWATTARKCRDGSSALPTLSEIRPLSAQTLHRRGFQIGSKNGQKTSGNHCDHAPIM
jgi:hypothetical protein